SNKEDTRTEAEYRLRKVQVRHHRELGEGDVRTVQIRNDVENEEKGQKPPADLAERPFRHARSDGGRRRRGHSSRIVALLRSFTSSSRYSRGCAHLRRPERPNRTQQFPNCLRTRGRRSRVLSYSYRVKLKYRRGKNAVDSIAHHQSRANPAVHPPSTTRTVPVTYLASSEAKYNAAGVISSGSAGLPRGMWLNKLSASSREAGL